MLIFIFKNSFRCYYPCSQESGFADANSSRWAKWYPSREYAEGMARFKFGDGVMTSLVGKLSQWMTHDPYVPAVDGAPLIEASSSGQSGLPLVVFSHGLGGNRTMYSSLLCHWASEGRYPCVYPANTTVKANSFMMY